MSDSQDTQTNLTAPPTARRACGGHPLGPLVRRVSHPKSLRTRLLAALILVGCLTLLALGVWLRPDRSGLGTHQQLGLPPCALVQFAGIPCPTCGMTTAFAYTVRGQWVSGFLAQPFAFMLGIATILCVPLSAQALLTGRTWQVNWYRLSPNRTMVVVIVFFVLAWGFKIIRHLALNG